MIKNRKRQRSVVFWAVIIVGICSACARSAVPLSEVDPAPIALVYWDESSARERADLIRESQQEGKRTKPGVAHVETLTTYLNAASGGTKSAGEAGRGVQFSGKLMLLDPRSLELKRFAAAPRNARPLAWSHDHERLLFNSRHMDNQSSQIYEYNLKTQEVRKLTRGPANHLEADFAPDGRILTSWVESAGSDIKFGLDYRPPGGGPPVEIFGGGFVTNPKWSPQGDKILYEELSTRSATRDDSTVYVQAPVPGAKPRKLARGREAVFSPDGKWIIYTTRTFAGYRLYRVRPDGSGRRALEGGSLDARRPAVSPDGKHVVYVASEAGIDRLYLRRMDGSGDRILLEEGSVAFPVW